MVTNQEKPKEPDSKPKETIIRRPEIQNPREPKETKGKDPIPGVERRGK